METCWVFEKRQLKDTPSTKDGIAAEKEARYREEGARFIIAVGSKMNLRYDTMATGVVYYHRFFMFHSFKDFSRYVVALGCLFLAGKVEETPKKCKDMISEAKESLTERQFAAFGDEPKEEVIMTERVLLQTVNFDLQVEHPYEYLLRYAKVLKGDKQKLQKLVQMAWTFVNDSLCTPLCLQWEPEIIAIALMYLASRLSKFEVTDWYNKKCVKGEKWWDQFVDDLSLELLEDICHQVLDLYSNKGTATKKAASGGSNTAYALPGSKLVANASTPRTSVSDPSTPAISTGPLLRSQTASSASYVPTSIVSTNTSSTALSSTSVPTNVLVHPSPSTSSGGAPLSTMSTRSTAAQPHQVPSATLHSHQSTSSGIAINGTIAQPQHTAVYGMSTGMYHSGSLSGRPPPPHVSATTSMDPGTSAVGFSHAHTAPVGVPAAPASYHAALTVTSMPPPPSQAYYNGPPPSLQPVPTAGSSDGTGSMSGYPGPRPPQHNMAYNIHQAPPPAPHTAHHHHQFAPPNVHTPPPPHGYPGY